MTTDEGPCGCGASPHPDAWTVSISIDNGDCEECSNLNGAHVLGLQGGIPCAHWDAYPGPMCQWQSPSVFLQGGPNEDGTWNLLLDPLNFTCGIGDRW